MRSAVSGSVEELSRAAQKSPRLNLSSWKSGRFCREWRT